MSLVTLDAASAEPPFEQVRRQIAEGVASGALTAGHRLPTVRQLAADLGVATNTVAKAYRALGADGVVRTQGRGGTLVAGRRLDDTEADLGAQTYARLARRQGLSIDEAVNLVGRHWSA